MFRSHLIALVTAVYLLAPSSADASETGYDYCAAFPDAGVTLLLLDRTSALDDEDRLRIKSGWDAFSRRKIQDGTRIVVRTIADYWTTSIEMFNGCFPACPQDLVGNLVGTCDRDGVAADASEFAHRLRRVVTEEYPLIASTKKPESGIVDTIAQAAHLYSTPGGKSRLKDIIVFSDFIEYHPHGGSKGGISFYHDSEADLLKYLEYVKTNRHIPHLSGVKVIGFGFGKALGPRASTQGVHRDMTEKRWDAIYKFWVLYFQKAGVTSDLALDLEFRGIKPAPVNQSEPPVERSPELVTAKKERRK